LLLLLLLLLLLCGGWWGNLLAVIPMRFCCARARRRLVRVKAKPGASGRWGVRVHRAGDCIYRRRFWHGRRNHHSPSRHSSARHSVQSAAFFVVVVPSVVCALCERRYPSIALVVGAALCLILRVNLSVVAIESWIF
jgi:hypothetical protein